MAMGMSSKFKKMDASKNSYKKKIRPMAEPPMGSGSGGGQALPSQSMGLKKAAKPIDPRVAARRKAMQKRGRLG